jgi:2-aminoethylphosphonate-pyruvate transaminase
MTPRRLFTPGPLNTAEPVREAMRRDLGSREPEFTSVVGAVRGALVDLAVPSHAPGYCAVLLPGSGTYAIEATLGTCVPDAGRVLIVVNGAYGERMRQIVQRLGVPHAVLRLPENQSIGVDALQAVLDVETGMTHVALVHCETTTGLLNPLAALAEVTRARGLTLVVDAMSSFGALPLDMDALGIHYLIASSNKCLEGVPGVSFVLADRRRLEACDGHARGYSLDLVAQLRALDSDGQFRFTPPTHVVLALAQALDELDAEGGVMARGARYGANQRRLSSEMTRLGFRPYLPAEIQGPIITTFHQPPPPFDFDAFYARLLARGFVLYPGKLTAAQTFRIGSIGQLFEPDMVDLARAAEEVLHEMGVELRAA